MVDLTRRKTVIGLGLLATGSGATFTSASFQSRTDPESDLRVVVDQNLQFGENPNLDPATDDDLTDNPDFFENPSGDDSGNLNESAGGAFDNSTANEPRDENDVDDDGFNEGFEPDLPLAYADGFNGNFVLKAAVQIGESNRFEDLLQIGNATESTVQIGIAYDRGGPGVGDNGNYGADITGSNVNTGSGTSKISKEKAQRIYQFQTSDSSKTLISPDPGADGEPGSSSGVTIGDKKDQPNDLVELAPGDSQTLDLVVDTADSGGPSKGTTDPPVTSDILSAADIDNGAFGFQTDTVQIMDFITVVSQPAP